MPYIKLQVACLIIVLYTIATYIRSSLATKIKTNVFFNTILIIAPLAIILDGTTAWTVNHMDTVPGFLNDFLHLLFFIFMSLSIVATTIYIYDQLMGISRKNCRPLILFLSTGILSQILILAGISRLRYVQGTITNYSMGFSVYVCFITMFLHYGFILYLIISRHKYITREKKFNTVFIIVLMGLIITSQILFPEVLLSSLCPTLIILGFFIDFENPALKKLTSYKDNMVEGFANLVENRDNNTGGHIRRTRNYVNLILSKMKKDRYYKSVINRDFIVNVSNAAPLHDIGKIATPDNILQKPGKLTDEEYSVMKKHAECGGIIILETFKNLDNQDFKDTAYQVARYHHEKYNGKGYPEGLKGEEIPLCARIMAIADVFDAVSQKRCYRNAMPAEECFKIIQNGIGTDFDPLLAKIFLDSRKEVEALMETSANSF
ncbi:HD domain-containing phosphohydrolase [uncultured Treponema sp.]|uniref:HD-GYP domain-containing protein n=1 Tax=uncultured Treponema sp. TaxID=162155 RepID=UPI0015B9B870|nr:HD domain-containing phosphohydrolase [uncultured Treponema sp.]